MSNVGSPPSLTSGSIPVEPFRLEEERLSGNDAILLAVYGDVDLHGAPELRDCLGEAIDEGVAHIVVDLSKATFMDSMALGVLLGALKRIRPQGGELRIVLPQGSALRRTFELTLLDQVFTLDTTRREALAVFMDPWNY
jgi:anti-sigma B factor antagonist